MTSRLGDLLMKVAKAAHSTHLGNQELETCGESPELPHDDWQERALELQEREGATKRG